MENGNKAVLCGLAMLACVGNLQADVHVFQNNFAGWSTVTAQNYTTINWDDVNLGLAAHTTILGSRYAGLYGSPTLTYTAVSGPSGLYVGSPANGFFPADFVPVSGSNVFAVNPFQGGPSAGPQGKLTITFGSGPMLSMGVWFLDVEEDYRNTGIEVNGKLYAFSQDQGDNTRSFLGIVSDTPFSSVTIHMSSASGSNGVGIDDVMWSPIPAPGAVLLGGLGFSCAGWFRRRTAV